MNKYKKRIILFILISLFLVSGCQKVKKIAASEIQLMVVLSDDSSLFGNTYLRFYNKDNKLIKEDVINDFGFYTNKIIDNEMFLLGSNYLYKIVLDDFSLLKVDIPNKDNRIIFDEIYADADSVIYKKNAVYNDKTDSIAEEYCIYDFSEEKCNSVNGIVKSLYINNELIYVLAEFKEHSELTVLDSSFNVISKIEYPEKNAAKILGINNNIYVELNDKVYDLERNIIYSSNGINHVFMTAIKYMNELNLLYMGNPSVICNLENNCFTYDAMLFEQGISSNGGIVFSANSNPVKKTISEDIILFENGSFKKINTIEYKQGLNIVGIYNK